MIEKNKKAKLLFLLLIFSLLAGSSSPLETLAATATSTGATTSVKASLHIDGFTARLPVHILGSLSDVPKGLTPDQIKKVYHLPETGGAGTIAIVGAYDDSSLETDLAKFSKQFGLPDCTFANKCLERHLMATSTATKEVSGWSLETALDTEWAHAIAPNAHILVVEAKTDSGTQLLSAIDYANSRKDVVAVSMSWGGGEFADETKMDSHFVNSRGVPFFASSGDSGYGVSWPAVSPNVIAVGGTSLAFKSDGSFESEKAWFGSGGGISAFESEPAFQTTYDIPRAGGKRAIPDVAYNADPYSGYAVYHAPVAATSKTKGWYVVGGTSAGAPQWAAIASLALGAAVNPATFASSTISNAKLYADKASTQNASFFRDITSGSNGTCVYFCDARKRYDYVTGLGAPLAVHF